MELMRKRKPANYWTIENVIKELRQFIRDHPEFKKNSCPEMLTLHKRDDLRRAIYKFKGLGYLNEQYNLGLRVSHRSIPKIKLLDELRRLIGEGYSIKQSVLRSIDRNDLLTAAENFGGLNAIKIELGLSIKKHNYWNNEVIVEMLRPIVDAYGRIPSKPVFQSLGKNDLFRAYEKRGGCKVFGSLLNTRSDGYYISNDGHYLQSGYECLFDNILHKYSIPHQIHGYISENYKFRYDFLVNGHYIELCGYSKKEHAVYHKRLRKKIQLYKNLKLPYAVFYKTTLSSNMEKLEGKVLEVLQGEISVELPTAPVVGSIAGTMPVSHWADIGNVKKILLPIVEKYGRFPLDREFREEKMSPLLHGIYQYHGGPYVLGRKLNIPVRYKPKGFYKESNAIEEYTELCLKEGRFLTQKDIGALGLHGLIGFIGKYGGMCKSRLSTKLPFQQVRLPYGYFTSDNAAVAYKQLCVQYNRFLSSKDLYKLKERSLANYIQTHGGYSHIRERTGLDFHKDR
jgi:hypothetical protein